MKFAAEGVKENAIGTSDVRSDVGGWDVNLLAATATPSQHLL